MSFPTSPPFKPTPLDLTTRYIPPGTVVVTVAGEVDIATAPALHAALVHALAVHVPAILDVDLSACTFLDACALRVLVTVQATALAAGCQMWARSPQPFVRMVLAVTSLLDVLTRPEDRTGQAVASPELGGPANTALDAA